MPDFYYVIHSFTEEGNEIFLHPQNDGNYVWSNKLLGAAVWKTFDSILAFKKINLNNNTKIKRVTVSL